MIARSLGVLLLGGEEEKKKQRIQMADNVSSKHASIFLAVHGRLWQCMGAMEKPPWCCLADPIKEEVIGPKALVTAPPPEEFHLGWKGQADLGSVMWLTCR